MPTATFTATLQPAPGHSLQCFIEVPKEIAHPFVDAGVSRVVALLNKEYPLHCALISRGELGYSLYFGKKHRKASGYEPGMELHIQLSADESQYGLPMPIELAELLEIDEEADEIFHSLTPGRQRTIIHMVGQAKREETRINRALRIVENLKLGIRDTREFLRKR